MWSDWISQVTGVRKKKLLLVTIKKDYLCFSVKIYVARGTDVAPYVI